MTMLDMLEDLLPEGWYVESESVLICPHGHPIELDGKCPEGCVSPLRKLGII